MLNDSLYNRVVHDQDCKLEDNLKTSNIYKVLTTRLSQDAHNQLNCLLQGTKEWIFIDNKYNDGIYQAEEVRPDLT